MTGEDLAAAAASLEGVPFRLNGRDRHYGTDCIGLLELALKACGQDVTLPSGYSLRQTDPLAWLPDPQSCGFAPARLPALPGDVVLIRLGHSHTHLAIAGIGASWIHAHAGLRRVVVSPDLPDGTIIGHWRILSTQ